MASWETRCRYFRSMMDHKTCSADIKFPGLDICYGRDKGETVCEFYSPPTADEIKAYREKTAKLTIELNQALSAIAKLKGTSGTIPCPRCGSELHWTRASYNGHVHGTCTTQGCVRWLQ